MCVGEQEILATSATNCHLFLPLLIHLLQMWALSVDEKCWEESGMGEGGREEAGKKVTSHTHFTPSPTPSLTHPLTPSPTHPLTYSTTVLGLLRHA